MWGLTVYFYKGDKIRCSSNSNSNKDFGDRRKVGYSDFVVHMKKVRHKLQHVTLNLYIFQLV